MDIDAAFEMLDAKLTPKNNADKIVERSESEFRGYSLEEKSRQKEIETLKEKIASLQHKIKKNPNIKNPRLVELNNKRAQKRKELKSKIEALKIRLEEIQEERQGTTAKIG